MVVPTTTIRTIYLNHKEFRNSREKKFDRIKTIQIWPCTLFLSWRKKNVVVFKEKLKNFQVDRQTNKHRQTWVKHKNTNTWTHNRMTTNQLVDFFFFLHKQNWTDDFSLYVCMCVRVSVTNRKSDMSPSIYIKVRIIDNRPKKKKTRYERPFFSDETGKVSKSDNNSFIHSFVHLMKLENWDRFFWNKMKAKIKRHFLFLFLFMTYLNHTIFITNHNIHRGCFHD